MPVLPGAEPFSIDGGPVGVLLCHGFTGSPQSLRPWGEYLADAGYTVRCPRLPGHGTTWRDMNDTRWTDWYAEVDRALDELRGRCERVVIAGLSMGGTLALRLAEKRGAELGDTLVGVIVVNPSLATERKDAALLPLLAKVVPSFPGISNDIKKPGARELAYNRIPLRAAYSLNQLWTVTRADLAEITHPVLLYRSAVDHVVEPVSGRLLVEGVSSTDLLVRILPNSYHVATLDNDSEFIFADSLAWIRERTATPLAAGPAEAVEP